MNFDKVKFEYILENYGWGKAIFTINEQLFSYDSSHVRDPLGSIFYISAIALDKPAKEGFNKHVFDISDEHQENEIEFLIKIGQERFANMKITEDCNRDSKKIVYDGVIDFYYFIKCAIESALSILREQGLVGYSLSWDHSFPLPEFLRTLDFFEDYHNLDWSSTFGVIRNDTLCRTNIFDEIKLLSKHLGKEPNSKVL